jgi:hypothetical protein
LENDSGELHQAIPKTVLRAIDSTTSHHRIRFEVNPYDTKYDDSLQVTRNLTVPISLPQIVVTQLGKTRSERRTLSGTVTGRRRSNTRDFSAREAAGHLVFTHSWSRPVGKRVAASSRHDNAGRIAVEEVRVLLRHNRSRQLRHDEDPVQTR